MQKQEIIDLYIEKRSLRETIYQLTRGCGARMETTLNELCCNLERKIDEIDLKLNQNPAETAAVVLEYREQFNDYLGMTH